MERQRHQTLDKSGHQVCRRNVSSLDQVRNELRPVGREEVGTPTQRTNETSSLGQSRLSQQHVVAHGPPNLGHEHCPAVHEDPVRANTWPSGKQQLLRRQYKHRAGRLGVVRSTQRVLGRVAAALQEEQRRLSSRILVGKHEGAG